MPRRIAFYFDFLSPYSYLAATQIEALAARHGCGVDHRVVELAELKRRAGNTGPSTRQMPVKLRYARTDMQRWASRYGVTLVPLSGNDSTRVDRGVFFADRAGRLGPYLRSVWAQGWAEGGDLASDALLDRAAAEAGLDAAALRGYVGGAEAAAALADATDAAARLGVFGVPTFIVDDQMWWGNDRLDFLEAYLAGA